MNASGRDLIVVALAACGVLFMLISAVGLLRLPNVLARMHAVGLAGTLGISAILLAAGLHFGQGQMLRMLALIVLFFVTSPVATTAMARAAYRVDPQQRTYLEHDAMAEPAAERADVGS